MSGRRTGRLRRTWPQRLLIIFNVCAIIAALASAGTLAYAKRKISEINRIDLVNSAFKGTEDVGPQDPRNFLIVGADSDAGLASNDPVRNGRDSGDNAAFGVRSDTIMVVRIDPKTTDAQILSFPRDLWVDIPGKSRNRINSSLQFGGPGLLISTIKQDFGIDINHYVQVDFAGFKKLVSLLGGVPVYFNTPVRDQGGLNVQYPGCTTLDQNGALAYVRARHFQYQNANGRWVGDPTSDLGRISRQQDFIRRVIRRAIAQGARNPVKLKNFVEVGIDNITLDNNTTPKDLIQLGSAFRNFDPARLKTYSLPVTDAVRGGAEVLDLTESEAEPILARFRGTGDTSQAAAITPAAVTVQVLNGTGKQDQASSTSDALRALGFQMDAPDQSSQVLRTEVRYKPGQEAQAAYVARYLYANPVLVPDIDAAAITVVTGPDFGTVLKAQRPAADIPVPTTSTTTTPATTTTLPSSTTAPGASTSGLPGTTTTPATTTTTAVGYVPGNAPAGVDCG